MHRANNVNGAVAIDRATVKPCEALRLRELGRDVLNHVRTHVFAIDNCERGLIKILDEMVGLCQTRFLDFFFIK